MIKSPVIRKVVPKKREWLSLLLLYAYHVMPKIERATKTENNSDIISNVWSSDWKLFNSDGIIVSSRKNPNKKTVAIIANNFHS
jgi:hypothetical protein